MNFPEPRPVQVVFPFAAARLALRRIEELIEVLTTIRSDHEQAHDVHPLDFAGLSQLRFDQNLTVSLSNLATEVSQLEQQYDDLSHALQRAETLDQQRRTELASWQRRRAQWNERWAGQPIYPQ